MKKINLVENALVVTRHQSMVDYLTEIGMIDHTATVKSHVNANDVKGKNVIGVLPHSLSCLTKSFTEIPLSVPPHLRGSELSLDNLKQYAKPPKTYYVSVKK